jgi:hypothetical protein
MPSRFQVARWVTCDDADGGEKELKRFIDANDHRMAYDAVDAPTVLVEYAPELRAIEANWPKIKFHALREHAGLVFQQRLEPLGLGAARACCGVRQACFSAACSRSISAFCASVRRLRNFARKACRLGFSDWPLIQISLSEAQRPGLTWMMGAA